MCIFYRVSALLFIMRPIGVIEPDGMHGLHTKWQ